MQFTNYATTPLMIRVTSHPSHSLRTYCAVTWCIDLFGKGGSIIFPLCAARFQRTRIEPTPPRVIRVMSSMQDSGTENIPLEGTEKSSSKPIIEAKKPTSRGWVYRICAGLSNSAISVSHQRRFMMTSKINDVQIRQAVIYSEAAAEIEPTTADNPTEQWKDIPGYDGVYQVSDQGRARSVNRTVVVKTKDGHEWQRCYKGQVLSTKVDYKSGLLRLRLSVNGKRSWPHLAKLVAKSFVDGYLPGHLVGYKDNDKWNTAADNLYWYNPRKHHRGDHPKRFTKIRGINNA